MKKYLSALLALALLCSCAARLEEGAVPASVTPAEPVFTAEAGSPAPAEVSGITANDVARAIVDSQPGLEDYAARAGKEDPYGEELALYLDLYGVDRDVVSDAAIYAVGGVDAREIAVLSLDHGTYAYDTASTAKAMEEYRQNRLADFVGYAPEQAAIVEKGRVVESESWAALLLCEDMTAAVAAFEEAAGAAILPEDNAPKPSPTQEPRYVRDERGYLPFLPPNQVDMTPYDTAAILAAWAANDPAELGEEDAAVYAKCREVFEEVIADGMTDFEKELILHDWLVDNGHYDQTVHDPATPDGLPHNKDPYGLLVEGYGICLGYATAFQLLMDLAGVECITVVGASGWSKEDHAWNMVRLEGEWYGVDVTWDDQTLTDPDSFSKEELSKRHHAYFNITSDELRGGNRQWDYDSVPEAADTRFRWDGTGPLPQ